MNRLLELNLIFVYDNSQMCGVQIVVMLDGRQRTKKKEW